MSPRVAVWGGSGFVGSRVCQLLTACGCTCVSLSRSGGPPTWAVGEAWTADVTWLVADAAGGPGHAPAALGQIDAAVSCVGNMRPSPNWDGFWGLHWEYAAALAFIFKTDRPQLGWLLGPALGGRSHSSSKETKQSSQPRAIWHLSPFAASA